MTARKKAAVAARAAETDAARAVVRWWRGLSLQDRVAFSGFFLATAHGTRCQVTQDTLDDLRIVLGHLLGHPDTLAGLAMKLGEERHALPEPGADIAGRIGPRGAA